MRPVPFGEAVRSARAAVEVGRTSRDASLSSEFPLAASTENGMKTLQGQVGSGGPKIEIRTTHGSVKLSKGPTAKPGEMQSHVPHFKSSKPVHTTSQ